MVRILFIFLIVLISNQLIAQNTIEDARRKSEGETVTITGVVTNGDELGLIKYMQDSSAGIAVYDNILEDVKRGDSITVTGKLDDFYNLLEVTNLSSLNNHSTAQAIPQPKVLDIALIGEDYEGQLIQIDNIEFEDAGNTFGGDSNYDFTDGSNTGVVRISKHSPIVGQTIPSGKISLVALCSQYSTSNNDTRNGYQLLPRDMNDFISGSSVNITTSLRVSNITQHSITLNWDTDTEATAEIIYGNSPNENMLIHYAQGSSTSTADGMSHQAEVLELQPSEIVYVKAFSVNGSDTAFSATTAFISESNSSGEIKVYFNSRVDETLATENTASYIGNAMEDTLASYINKAQESIDFCIYNFDNSSISDALNAAYDRGVQIRFITCGSTKHYGVQDLNAAIPVLERPEIEDDGLMHNKFAIFDANSNDANSAWVWSGSTNLTENQLYSDANNMIFIQDKSLALTYKIEFEEMWGSSGNAPNANKAKFGDRKTNNTPHELLINGNRVECYFSPSDNTNQKLIDAMATADEDLNVQTMLITRTDLANSIADAANRGVDVNVITDDERDNSESANDILNQLTSDKYIFDDVAGGTLHHKMALIDAKAPNSDPQVITGSHNWSNSANIRNDENTLIIHNANITNQYYQQFAYRFEQNGGNFVISAEDIRFSELRIFPNPTADKIRVIADQNLKKVKIYSAQGILIQELIAPGGNAIELDLSGQTNGIYLLQIESEKNKVNTYKIIKN